MSTALWRAFMAFAIGCGLVPGPAWWHLLSTAAAFAAVVVAWREVRRERRLR